MCEKCKAAGLTPKVIEIALTVEFENGVKEIPFRAWSDEGHTGLHVCIEGGKESFVSHFIGDILPSLKAELDKAKNIFPMPGAPLM